jgi:hypothetical protein
MRTIRIFLPLLALAVAGGFAQPAAAQGGVTLFEHPDYGGASQSFTGDVARLGVTQVGNDRVSSVRVAPGCVATLYRDADFRGRATVLRGDVRHLAGSDVGNDTASSLRIECGTSGPHGVTLFTDSEFRGRQATFYGDTPDLTRDGYPDDATSSARVPAGCSLTLYEHPDYRGRAETIYEDDPLLANNRIGNDVVSSLRVRCSGTAIGGPVTSPPPFGTSGVFRCDDRDSGIAFRVSETGRDRGRASLLLADTEVATFQARRVGNAYELRPVGRSGGMVRLDLTRNEITVGMNGSQRTLCRWR